jgi:hypothetical protein
MRELLVEALGPTGGSDKQAEVQKLQKEIQELRAQQDESRCASRLWRLCVARSCACGDMASCTRGHVLL